MNTIGIPVDFPVNRVNLWEDPLDLKDLQQLIAMIIDVAGYQVVRGETNGLLYIQEKGPI